MTIINEKFVVCEECAYAMSFYDLVSYTTFRDLESPNPADYQPPRHCERCGSIHLKHPSDFADQVDRTSPEQCRRTIHNERWFSCLDCEAITHRYDELPGPALKDTNKPIEDICNRCGSQNLVRFQPKTRAGHR